MMFAIATQEILKVWRKWLIIAVYVGHAQRGRHRAYVFGRCERWSFAPFFACSHVPSANILTSGKYTFTSRLSSEPSRTW